MLVIVVPLGLGLVLLMVAPICAAFWSSSVADKWPDELGRPCPRLNSKSSGDGDDEEVLLLLFRLLGNMFKGFEDIGKGCWGTKDKGILVSKLWLN